MNTQYWGKLDEYAVLRYSLILYLPRRTSELRMLYLQLMILQLYAMFQKMVMNYDKASYGRYSFLSDRVRKLRFKKNRKICESFQLKKNIPTYHFFYSLNTCLYTCSVLTYLLSDFILAQCLYTSSVPIYLLSAYILGQCLYFFSEYVK